MDRSSAATSYFTDCCMAIIDGNFMAPRCGLKLGHEGPHEPIKAGTQTVSDSPAATPYDGRNDEGRNLDGGSDATSGYSRGADPQELRRSDPAASKEVAPTASPAQEVVIDGERYYAESKLVAALACVYPNSGTLVAHLCDEHLSRSGRLLGIVRDVAMEARRAAS